MRSEDGLFVCVLGPCPALYSLLMKRRTAERAGQRQWREKILAGGLFLHKGRFK